MMSLEIVKLFVATEAMRNRESTGPLE